jgi:hypothetical protein
MGSFEPVCENLKMIFSSSGRLRAPPALGAAGVSDSALHAGFGLAVKQVVFKRKNGRNSSGRFRDAPRKFLRIFSSQRAD